MTGVFKIFVISVAIALPERSTVSPGAMGITI
jgi:hypothetical protein